MKKEMNLDDKYFKLIKSGEKTVEIRLYDVKRRSLKVGDIITFNNRNTKEKTDVLIVALNKYNSFKELASNYDINALGIDDIEEVYKYYTKEEEEKYHVLAIELRRI